MNDAPLTVIGAGSWGTALAIHLAGRGDVRLWCRPEDQPERIAAWRENRTYLPGVTIPERVRVTSDLDEAREDAALTVLALPTQFLRAFLAAHREGWSAGPLVTANKGIEVGTLAFPSRIVAEALGAAASHRTVVLSGPSFAREVVLGCPTAIVAASSDATAAGVVQRRVSHDNVRVYTSPDPIGTELAGALKNVVAIAAGIADGLGIGTNAAAALITRALAEISRLGVALGAQRETFMGLAGIGDLVLTCTGALSRNRQVGQQIGRGHSLADILADMAQVAEGVETTRAARALARSVGVDMPIVDQVHALLFEGKDPKAGLAELLARPLKAEPEGSGR